MAKRRKLPAPPLVLGRHIARLPEGSQQVDVLRALGIFLERKDLLTDGGKKSLQNELRGRNHIVSLGLQDVKSCAHGLAESLWTCGSEELWPGLTEEYFQTYDRGKPRRPTHLQRLYLEWSPTLDWVGLLRILPHHPFLWKELQLALERIEDPLVDKDCLLLALACRQSVEPWRAAWAEAKLAPEYLLRLLPHLELPLDRRLRILGQLPPSADSQDWVRACHCRPSQARGVGLANQELGQLETRAMKILGQVDSEFLDPLFVSAFRAFVTCENTVIHLADSISPVDPLRRVVYGARPGRAWLLGLLDELRELIALRSASSR